MASMTIDPERVRVARELHEVDRKIRRGRDAGQLSRQEARRARQAGAAIGAAADRLGADGLDMGEARDLELQARALQSLVDAQRFRPDDRPPR